MKDYDKKRIIISYVLRHELFSFFFTLNNEDRKEQKDCLQFEWEERIRCTLKNFKTKHLVIDYYCKKFIEQLNSIKNIA